MKALFFDFDGLILDTETPEVRAWEEIYRRHGLEFPFAEWSKVVGGWGMASFDPVTYLLAHHPDGLTRTALQEQQQQISRAYLEAERPRPGVTEWLETARRLDLRCLVVSSSSHAWVDGHLERLGLRRYFERVICAEDVPPGRTKPHPDLYLKALELSQLSPAQVLVLEDSPNGVRAARAAGLRVIAIPNPVTARIPFSLPPDAQFGSLSEVSLPEMLRRLEVSGVRNPP